MALYRRYTSKGGIAMGNLESENHRLTCLVCIETGSCKTRREIEAEEGTRSVVVAYCGDEHQMQALRKIWENE